jgi:hypothetical protein
MVGSVVLLAACLQNGYCVFTICRGAPSERFHLGERKSPKIS